MKNTQLGVERGEILIQDSKGRVRTPLERREALLEEYERSGMSGLAFAQHTGIKYQTFASWVQKRRRREFADQKAPGMSKPVQWVEAVVSDQSGSEGSSSGLLIELSGGAKMQIGDSRGAMLAAEVLRYLGEARR